VRNGAEAFHTDKSPQFFNSVIFRQRYKLKFSLLAHF
jgi:hypothetical protein